MQNGSFKFNLLLWIQAVFYTFAGINHFVNPEFYYPLIPDYLPWKVEINIISGVAEVVLGVMLVFQRLRWVSCVGVIAMLIAFVPSHIHFILIGSCIDDGLCVSPWVGWLRLLLIHPLLIYCIWRIMPRKS